MKKHTAEPWKAQEYEGMIFVSNKDTDVANCYGDAVDIDEEQGMANAKRIAACVNACRGVKNLEAVKDAIYYMQQQAKRANGYVARLIVAKLKGTVEKELAAKVRAK